MYNIDHFTQTHTHIHTNKHTHTNTHTRTITDTHTHIQEGKVEEKASKRKTRLHVGDAKIDGQKEDCVSVQFGRRAEAVGNSLQMIFNAKITLADDGERKVM